MTVRTPPASTGPATRRPSARQITGLRRTNLAAFVLLVIQYGIGMGVSLYVTVPAADRGHGFGQAISNGPAALTVHVVVGLLLVAAALGLIVQAVLARHAAVIVTSVIGLLALAGAASQGSDFVSTGHDAASMGMAVLTGVALLCYGASLYVLARPRS